MADSEQTLKVVGGFLLVVIFTLAYVLGQSAQTKTQRNMLSRLELTRQRHQHCETERRMLSGGSMKGKEADELKIAEQDHQALVSENQLLNEDNQQLRQDNYALEEQIDELRDELDDKDFVSDDEVEQLEDTMSLGNNSVELKEFLDDAQILGGINKDTLITKLMSELKRKRQWLAECKKQAAITLLKHSQTVLSEVKDVDSAEGKAATIAVQSAEKGVKVAEAAKEAEEEANGKVEPEKPDEKLEEEDEAKPEQEKPTEKAAEEEDN
eukprot:NODE_1128_length_1092_cov_242.586769_g862_i0.p1 GENE.NODE_1128_length_1092_cov_242.586769_g862_i0~~NODE_1128_length_1092_cov_242.586769_g862_i0.p1  ORF type:complete len:268 (+),score=79.47 NODE_1128_length_1092_cov_242.586769_g862_i0:70-873(+)